MEEEQRYKDETSVEAGYEMHNGCSTSECHGRTENQAILRYVVRIYIVYPGQQYYQQLLNPSQSCDSQFQGNCAIL
jgi:hypothetical protein